MDTIKAFLKYISWIVILYVLSDFLINVGLNSTYRDMQRLDNTEHIQIYQAEATMVNGRIKGLITNEGANDLNNKYVKVQLYTARDIEIGRKYIKIADIDRKASKPFEVFFQMQDIEKYKVTIIDEEKKLQEDANPSEIKEIEISKDMTNSELLMRVAFTMLMFI